MSFLCIMHSTNLGSYWTGQTGTEDWPVPLVAYDESICASSRGDFAQSSNCGSMSTDGTFSGHCLLQHSEAEREPNREASLSNGRRGDLGQVHQAAFARKDSQIGIYSGFDGTTRRGARRNPGHPR